MSPVKLTVPIKEVSHTVGIANSPQPLLCTTPQDYTGQMLETAIEEQVKIGWLDTFRGGCQSIIGAWQFNHIAPLASLMSNAAVP